MLEPIDNHAKYFIVLKKKLQQNISLKQNISLCMMKLQPQGLHYALSMK